MLQCTASQQATPPVTSTDTFACTTQQWLTVIRGVAPGCDLVHCCIHTRLCWRSPQALCHAADIALSVVCYSSIHILQLWQADVAICQPVVSAVVGTHCHVSRLWQALIACRLGCGRHSLQIVSGAKACPRPALNCFTAFAQSLLVEITKQGTLLSSTPGAKVQQQHTGLV